MSTRSSLLLLIAGALTSACILAVSFEDPENHCRIAGADTACGRCLTGRCAASIDACCVGDACGGVLTDVDACANGDTSACARVADPEDRGGAHATLSTCTSTACSEPCAIPARRHVTHCERAFVTSIDACRCDVATRANDTVCSEIGHPRLRCCAQDGWPDATASCDCLSIVCVSAGSGCICQLSAVDENNRPTECSGQVCCASLTEPKCTCGSTACAPDERTVTSCTIDELAACGSGKQRVPACSIEK